MAKLTPAQNRALTIIKIHGGKIKPARFARLMWPTSRVFRRTYRGAGYLGVLARMGYVYRRQSSICSSVVYILTENGHRALETEVE